MIFNGISEFGAVLRFANFLVLEQWVNMLQNEYLVAKIDFDTAENEPLKIWGELL